MIDLSGTWRLTDDTGECSLPIELPGDTFTALLEAGRIPDPYHGRNELDVQWVGHRTWTVERDFHVDSSPAVETGAVTDDEASVPRSILVIDVVDTVSEIAINGRVIAHTTSMFLPVRVDVAHVLKPGNNTIRITLYSAEAEAQRRAETLPYPVPHQIYPVQSMHRNLLRKAQCHAGWDWGPAMMVSGVYGRIGIEETPSWAIVHAWGVPRREKSGSSRWRIPVVLELDTDGGGDIRRDTGGDIREGDHRHRDGRDDGPHTYSDADRDRSGELPSVHVRVLDPAGVEIASGEEFEILRDLRACRVDYRSTDDNPSRDTAPTVRLRVSVSVDSPDLWWPAGYGKQTLYTVEVHAGTAIRTFRTAFRTIQLVNEEDDHGRSFAFRVNGRDLWARGANWIPVDAFPSRQTPERYRALLEDTVAANMNMLRVWGGGQYEPDLFYDMCDELGILVWQDFMFSCALYPSEAWFLQEVRREVTYQVKRLTSHPSIAVWCGNNENVGALGWYRESRENPGRYLIDYDRLNSGVVGSTVRALDDTRAFWPSSPAAGEGDFSDNWHDDSAGDMHYWSVWHEGKPFDAYHQVTPRFCSEFGFQSFPSIHGIRSFTEESQHNPTAPDLEHHQRHPRGNTVITETMTRYFRFPFDFGDFLYLSQVQQAIAIRTAVDFWRSRRPVSMGALYWQLNDLWPVASWSSIEYDGRWKLLHFEARRFFAPCRLVCQVHDGTVETWLINDTTREIAGGVTVRALSWNGETLLEETVPVTVGADAAGAVDRRSLEDVPFERTAAFVVAEWHAPGSRVAESAEPLPVVERGWTFLTEPKRCELQPPVIDLRIGAETDIRSSRETTVALPVRVECREAPAFFLQLEASDPGARFSDNGFLILPGEERTIMVTGTDGSVEIRTRTLRSTY